MYKKSTNLVHERGGTTVDQLLALFVEMHRVWLDFSNILWVVYDP
jgi:hypothetical protein